jgi:short-subunit dehydrogenase
MKEMSERKDGHIVNIVSTVALQKQANFGVYTASKFAFDGLTGACRL